MARRKLYPMPVEAIFDHPAYVAMPAAAVGMLHRLTEHFWKSECRALPRDDDQLFAVARAHRPTWRHHKAAVLQVFEDVRPELEAYWRLRQDKTQGMRIAAQKGGQKRWSMERLAAIQQAAPLAPSAVSAPVKTGPKTVRVQRPTDQSLLLDAA